MEAMPGRQLPSASIDQPAMTEGQDVRQDRRMATVLFADIVGSSRCVALSDPEDARDTLAASLEMIAQQVMRFGGTVCQTLGDGILAIFGAPDAQEDHAIRAGYAAEAIVGSARIGLAGAPDAALRVGIASGEILWDGTALNRNDRPPAIGRAVHMAARLQQRAEPNHVLVSEATFHLISDWADLSLYGRLRLAGEEEETIFKLLAMRSRRRRQDGLIPLVGRSTELAVLRRAVEDMRTKGRGATHLLVAPPGLGKSRLLAEVAAQARKAGCRVLEWQMHAVRPVGAPSSIQDLVTGLINRDLPGTREEMAALFEAVDIPPTPAAALADFLAVTDKHMPPADDSDGGSLAGMAGAIVDLVRIVARKEPVLLALEDAHWAGSDAQAVMEALAGAVPDMPLVLVMTSRTPPALPGTRVHQLAPLSPEAMEALLGALMGWRPELEDLKEALLRRVQGNPFFLQECVRGLVDDGALIGTPGDFKLMRDCPMRLPETVQAVLTDRIDRLDRMDRRLLLAAAVVGISFDAGLLSELVNWPLQKATDTLARLSRMDFLQTTRLLPRLEYTFTHALLHEAAYATLTKKDRKLLHGRLAALLDGNRFGDMPGRLAALARHAYHGELWRTAMEAGWKAGEMANLQSLSPEAVSLLSLALDAFERQPLSERSLTVAVDLRVSLARVAMPLGRQGSAREHLDRAAILAREAGDPLREVSALLGQVSMEQVYGSVSDAVRLAEAAVATSRRVESDGEPHHEALIQYASALLDRGDYLAADQIATWARRRAEAGRGTQGCYMTFEAPLLTTIQRARCHAEFGEMEATAALISSALSLADSGQVPFHKVFCWTFLAETCAISEDFASCLALSRNALLQMQETGSNVLKPLALSLAGLAEVRLGRAAEGMSLIQQALHAAKWGAGLCRLRLIHCLAEYWCGEVATAKALARETARVAMSTGQAGIEARATYVQALCARKEGDFQTVRQCGSHARMIAQRLGMSLLVRQIGDLMEPVAVETSHYLSA